MTDNRQNLPLCPMNWLGCILIYKQERTPETFCHIWSFYREKLTRASASTCPPLTSTPFALSPAGRPLWMPLISNLPKWRPMDIHWTRQTLILFTVRSMDSERKNIFKVSGWIKIWVPIYLSLIKTNWEQQSLKRTHLKRKKFIHQIFGKSRLWR